MQAEGEEGNQDHLGAVGWQAEAGVGRLLLHCSPLQPSLVVVLDKMDYQWAGPIKSNRVVHVYSYTHHIPDSWLRSKPCLQASLYKASFRLHTVGDHPRIHVGGDILM